jgi:hypothetical protein
MAKKQYLFVTLPDGTKDKRETARLYTHVVAFRMTPATFSQCAEGYRSMAENQLKQADKYDGIMAGTVKPDIRNGSAHDLDVEFHEKSLADGRYVTDAAEAREAAAFYESLALENEALAQAGTIGPWGALSWHGSEALTRKAVAASWKVGEYRIVPVDSKE